MKDKQLRIIFVWFLLAWIIASGLLTLLPVHARQLGAAPGLVGYYLAFAYVMILSGSLTAGWLSRRPTNRRKWLIIFSVGVPIGVALMIPATNVWQLAGATAITWFAFGLMGPLGNTLIGLRAKPSERGRVFGVIGMTQGLGTLIGGAVMGPAADAWGYRGMFLLAFTLGCFVLLFALLIQDVEHAPKAPAEQQATPAGLPGRRYWVFLGALVLAGISVFVAGITKSLLMHAAGFAATAISSTGLVSGLVLLFTQPMAGWLSDRVGRRSILVGTFAATVLGLLVMSSAVALWHFWVAAVVLSIGGARPPLQRALVADTLDEKSMDLGMALLACSGWVGGIIGFGLAGQAYEVFGGRSALRGAAVLPLLGMIVLLAVRLGRDVPAARAAAEPGRPAHDRVDAS